MAEKDDVNGVKHEAVILIEDIVKIEEAAKILRHIVSINARVLNDLIINNHPVLSSYLRCFITAHNQQVNVITALDEVINEMYRQLLSGGENE